MARKKNKKRNKYTTAGRVDMSKGGRVAKQEGGQEFNKPFFDPKTGRMVGLPTNQMFNVTQASPTPSPTPAPTPAPTPSPQEIEKERQKTFARTKAEESAVGTLPEASKIPDVVKVGDVQRDAEGNPVVDEEGNTVPIVADQKATPITAIQDTAKVKGSTIKTTGEESVLKPETVDTIADAEITAAKGPAKPLKAASFDSDQITEKAQVQAAQGELSDQAIAEAAGVDRIDPIEAATVNIPEGALANRVVGTISPEAKSQAAVNAGSSLARITRAKKQLANAGLSEADIAELGNDPEALEDRLSDFSEKERGLIAGLPEEALVSNQLDSLLTGIEEGEIPTWARPAVSAVEQMLAQRGMSASTVGRDALLNAIIQSAIPLAQSNAQAIQQSVAQQKTIEAQEAEANAQRVQQTAINNANKVFQLNLAQFSADQQTELANSKFLQTVGLSEANMEQQGILQNAVLMSQANIAEANFNQQAQINNAKAFLQMDMANLSNEQQANILSAQQNQQRMLSNQAAENAARQFNAASQNQTNQYMASLNAQISQFNASQANAIAQFNAAAENAANARDAQREVDVAKFNAQLETQVEQFNANQEFARNQWNAQNRAAVEASNVQWRRQANTANTAAQNAVNMQNAQNAFAMTQTAQSFLWQELRDQADYDFRASENERNRIAQLVNTALASDPSKYGSSINDIKALITTITGDLIGG